MDHMSQADYARRLGVSRPTISKWVKLKRVILIDGLVDVAQSDYRVGRYRVGGMPAVNDAIPTPKRGRPVVTRAVSLGNKVKAG